mmetsp:Transcript_29806/g.44056  ORF Transcript_29806/g.44056 Transcript_29806/m.44056 type:complete len:773 (-) Transcript_29806:38-2356(-)
MKPDRDEEETKLNDKDVKPNQKALEKEVKKKLSIENIRPESLPKYVRRKDRKDSRTESTTEESRERRTSNEGQVVTVNTMEQRATFVEPVLSHSIEPMMNFVDGAECDHEIEPVEEIIPGAYKIRGMDYDGNKNDDKDDDCETEDLRFSIKTKMYKLAQFHPATDPALENDTENPALMAPTDHNRSYRPMPDDAIQYDHASMLNKSAPVLKVSSKGKKMGANLCVQEIEPPKKKWNKKTCYAAVLFFIICIVVLVVVLVVVASSGDGNSSNNKTESTSIDTGDISGIPAVDECQHAGAGNFSMAWKECLCNEEMTNIHESHENQYNILKEVIKNQTSFEFDYNVSSCEAPNIALHWLSEDVLKRDGEAKDTLSDRFALAVCFISWTKSDPYRWKNQAQWMTDDSVCGWFGVACDENGEVTSISLVNNLLSGSIPTEIALLNQLTSLDLMSILPTQFGNEIEGSIPSEMGELTRLQSLRITSNKLYGTIPSTIGKCSNLKEVWLADNALTGRIPTEVGLIEALNALYLVKNDLTDFIPSEIGVLSHLEQLDLSQNLRLGGSIPSAIGNLQKLRSLQFYETGLSGTVPSAIGTLTSLREIDLSTNKLRGSIPSTVWNLPKISKIDLRRNILTGTIATTIGNCTSLKSLVLVNNMFTGSIPSEIGSMQQLEKLKLDNNKFEGSIPSHIGNCQALTHLDVSGNTKMTGTIPWELGNLYNLEFFDFSEESVNSIVRSSFTGTIPDEICSLLVDGKLAELLGSCGVTCECCTSGSSYY